MTNTAEKKQIVQDTQIFMFKWSVSRSTGYNIVRIYLNDKKTKFYASGGNYDMEGTALGEFLQTDFQDRLKELFKDLEVGKHIDARKNKFYGAFKSCDSDSKILLDGATGKSSMIKILEAIDLRLEYVSETKNTTTYLLHNYKPETA